ncbi:MAG: hypothetical protein ACI906_000864 [Candidatus Latescibacterota bacterium]|jgi:hypothetical protein
MKKWMLILACFTWATAPSAYAGEALITKVRGSMLTIDAGAESGLVRGLPVSIVRPPGEAIIHPITGENLGAPEVIIGTGEVSKTSNRAANIQIGSGLLMTVRPGDIARFTTPEEDMLIDQERTVASSEKNLEEHQGFRNEISRLTRSIKGVSKRIGGLEGMMKRVERVEEGFRVQLRGINTDMNTMKEDITDLKESVALMGSVPVDGLEGDGASTPVDLSSEESVEQIREIVRGVLGDTPAQVAPVSEEERALPEEVDIEALLDAEEPEDGEGEGEGEGEEDPFYLQTWFFGIIGAIGILGVAAFAYLRMMADGEEDEEDEDDEEIEEDDDDMDMDDDLDMDDMEIEEEDDIVVEETS